MKNDGVNLLDILGFERACANCHGTADGSFGNIAAFGERALGCELQRLRAAAPANPEGARALISHVGQVADGLPQDMLDHWFDQGGDDYDLTEGEFRAVFNGFSLESNQTFKDLLSINCSEGSGSFSAEIPVYVGCSKIGRTIGQHLIMVKFEVECNSCSGSDDICYKVNGTFSLHEEIYDYDPKKWGKRNNQAEIEVRLVNFFAADVADSYQVNSPEVPFSINKNCGEQSQKNYNWSEDARKNENLTGSKLLFSLPVGDAVGDAGLFSN